MLLDIFACAPVTPDDGYTYLMGPMQRCESLVLTGSITDGNLRQKLFPFSFIGIILFTIGWPAFVFGFWYRNRELIVEDQL
jgi:hypothetical protein